MKSHPYFNISYTPQSQTNPSQNGRHRTRRQAHQPSREQAADGKRGAVLGFHAGPDQGAEKVYASEPKVQLSG